MAIKQELPKDVQGGPGATKPTTAITTQQRADVPVKKQDMPHMMQQSMAPIRGNDDLLPGGGGGWRPGNNTGGDTALDTPTDGQANKPGPQYQQVRNQLVGNAQGPQLPEGTEQTFTKMTEGAGESMDPTKYQMGEAPQVTAASAAAQGYTAAQAAAANATDAQSYQASQAQAAQAAEAIKGEVDRLVTGTEVDAITVEAQEQDLDKLDPRTTVDAITKDLPNEATVKGNMDDLLAGLESGDVPLWAQPAVAAAEAAMSARGISSSSVGRNALFNSIISAALPIAQQDAKAKLSVFQQNLTNEQQAELANSQFFQTLTVKNLDNRQQAAIVNATNAQNAEIATAQNMTQASIENAKNFLSMNLANMSNEQQTLLANAQFRQQAILSNQAAENTAKQFNASSQQQADQFNASLKSQIDMFNTSQVNTARQFSAAAANQASIANAQMANQAAQFNAGLQFQRDQFNTQNALAIEQSNVNWRRQMNQINTAGENAVNQANAMNRFNLSNQALSFLWQEQRDNAKWANDNAQNEEERKTRMAIAALSNESMSDATTLNNIKTLTSAAISIFDNWGG